MSKIARKLFCGNVRGKGKERKEGKKEGRKNGRKERSKKGRKEKLKQFGENDTRIQLDHPHSRCSLPTMTLNAVVLGS